MRVAYLVVAFSSPYLVETIHSIPVGSRLLVVDNSQHPEWSLSKAWNYGVNRLCRQEGYDAVVVCNDDIVLTPRTGDTLAETLLAHPELLAVSARHLPPGTEMPTDLGVGTCDFGCFCVNARLLDLAGEFDENFFPAWHEDCDAHQRIRVAGYEAASCGYAPYFHYLNGTINSDPGRKSMTVTHFPQGQAYYLQKWGGLPGHERYTRPFNGNIGYMP